MSDFKEYKISNPIGTYNALTDTIVCQGIEVPIEFADKLISSQVDIDPEFVELVNMYFWEL